LRIAANVGAPVSAGEVILIVESMKMETEIHAPVDGTIAEIPVGQGDQVKAGDVLAVIAR
jgi:biotin carboxyl carrier protein